jgi:hypothetical protein
MDIPNPAVHFFNWNGDTGGFRYFDKSLGEKGERVSVPLPFSFMVLDTLSTIKGYNDFEKSGYWSNEIRDIKRDILTVKSKSGTISKGTYEQVITDRACSGAKYCQSVYVAIKIDGEMKIANIQMLGAALGSWIDFRKKNNIYSGAITVDSFVEGKKGKTVYQIPVFRSIPCSDDSNTVATDLDKQLQEYLKGYFERTGEKIAETHLDEKVTVDVTEAPEKIDDSDGLPF